MCRLCRIPFGLVAVSFLIASLAHHAFADEQIVDWLRGSGSTLELRLKGEVVESDGSPASNIHISGAMNRAGAPAPLAPTIDVNQFELWIPVNREHPYSLWLRAASENGERVAYKELNNYELRQAAIDGLKLTLRAPERHIAIKVFYHGEPVAGATVKAMVGSNIEIRLKTNADGIANVGLLPEQELQQLMAWTDDYRIGGFGFDRKPTRDPNAAEQTIELSRCRDQTLKFVDENGTPVEDIRFKLNVATPPPDYNFIGMNENFVMTTDKNGEVAFKWFPDWEKAFYYAELDRGRWVPDGDPTDSDCVKLFKLKTAKPRNLVEGRLNFSENADTPPGGFFVTLDSFQGEQANTRDIATVFTNSDGSFTLDVLADATYCAWVLDAKWVGNIIAVTPYQALTDKRTPPMLTVTKGQPIEVQVTRGSEHKPYPSLIVGFTRDFEYNWREPGQTQSGTSGPQWWATTDATGRAVTQTLPGKMRLLVYTPHWQTEKSIQVVADEPAKFELNQKVADERVVKGQLTLAYNAVAALKDAAVTIHSMDGDFEDEQHLQCDENGAFSFKSQAATVGVYAKTSDGHAAGSRFLDEHATQVDVPLKPTVDFDGQLLGDGDQPVAGARVQAYVRMEGKPAEKGSRPIIFDAEFLDALTDGQGRYTLHKLPRETTILLLGGPAEDAENSQVLDEMRLTSNEQPRPAVHHLRPAKRKAPPLSLADRYKSAMRDARLVGYRVLVILTDGDPNASDFVDRNFLDYVAHRDAYSFMQVVAGGTDMPLTDADTAFLKEHGWPLAKPGHVIAYALEADHESPIIDQIDVEPRLPAAADAAAAFLHKNAPPMVDAAEKWKAAFAEAKRTNRRVWARVSQKFCGPCWQLTRWLDDEHTLLEKDYVFVKIDDAHDANGAATAEKLTHGENHGIPFHAIFDDSEKMLVDSTGPRGNVGSFNGEEGKKQLRKMLVATRQKLTDKEVDQLVGSIDR